MAESTKPSIKASTKPSAESALAELTTEARNPQSLELDKLDAAALVKLINSEDAKVASAVQAESENIAMAIEIIADRLATGGRLIYMGAGTSGRLGVLDAVECPPTFNSPPNQVIGLMAGGQAGLIKAVEGAEDSAAMGQQDLAGLGLTQDDVVVGIAASGRTPYVIGGLDYARTIGAFALGFSCNPGAEIMAHADLSIIPVVGPEVLSGSTRLKAGTATKLVLNMLTTGAMVLLGKTYSNLMVDLQATNSKLELRARRIVEKICTCDSEQAEQLLAECDGEVKTAVIVKMLKLEPAVARQKLATAKGHLRAVLEAGIAPKSDQSK